jgi:predicted O-methyltransferase YrrM
MMAEIEAAVPEGGTWCSFEKAGVLASIIVATRPEVVVELGVWQGGSAIPMGIALRGIGAGKLIAIDAWSAEASVVGQKDEHLKWWGETQGTAGHDRAYEVFLARLKKHGITEDRCEVRRQQTDQSDVPEAIDVLHHDANHGPQAVRDIDRWAPAVRVGGFLIIDDLDWPGDAAPDAPRYVRHARDRAIELGFVDLYPLGTGCVMQRVADVRSNGAAKRYTSRAGSDAKVAIGRRGTPRH